MSRCWARHGEAPFERCELAAGHESFHEVRQTWDDDECWEPTPHDVEAIRMVPVIEAPITSSTSCFVCGCLESQHGVAGCEAHSCRTFVPS
jgi:hypothetical protein